MKLVVVESPFGSKDLLQIRRNILYLRHCLRDALGRGEAPYASHALYPQPFILDDHNPQERAWGIEAGLAWGDVAALRAVYLDLGISSGMEKGIARAEEKDQLIENRNLTPDLMDSFGRAQADDAVLNPEHLAAAFEKLKRKHGDSHAAHAAIFEEILQELPQNGIWL